jgi:ubiquinone/menaquinone biosynthesis C-methylase UbiE
MADLATDLGSLTRPDWTDDHVRRYQSATYGPSHRREYLRVRSETIAALVNECRERNNPPRVLEVACGPGLSLDYLSRAGGGVRLAGIDASGAMLRLAATNLGGVSPAPGLAQASARHLPFRDESFDLVFATRFIHMFRHKRSVVDELKRVTRRGGLVAIEFYPRPYHFARWAQRRSREPLGEFLYHYPRMKEVRRVMGPGARYIPVRFGGERWLRRTLSDSQLRALLRRAWNTPLRALIAEYFAVVRRT